ncbi:MAG: PIN domain nuclease [Candidatus Methylomirabilota bacterium]|nr:type II toxin-antitoxin system VapC family toxin [candidate division NC10 bacterium]PWB42844.1 MAG: PIN domain nuclease [candidate division NC10 bacterium]
MSAYVVDASIGVKWFIPEVHSEAARRLRAAGTVLHAPALFQLELNSVLCKLVRRGEITPREAHALQREVSRLPVRLHADEPVLLTAFDMALELQHSLYDCIYLALAITLDAQLVTSDRKLVEALTGTPLERVLCWVEDLPVNR